MANNSSRNVEICKKKHHLFYTHAHARGILNLHLKKHFNNTHYTMVSTYITSISCFRQIDTLVFLAHCVITIPCFFSSWYLVHTYIPLQAIGPHLEVSHNHPGGPLLLQCSLPWVQSFNLWALNGLQMKF